MKSAKWLSGSICLLLLAVVPAMNSKAFSPTDLQSGTDCHALSLISNQNLSSEQRRLAQQCDNEEAEQAWHIQYGRMRNTEISSAIVYDPS
ncbi:MAG: hypothetical protein Q4A84_10695 [Neisseria sp.]|uniref:hypothetical protein n=1 Tax=Neisseria sp. TaxID=192066 RepID=UPI0026DD96FF|nr:hypothetical protein [Neisseria sp.]MDO4642146.1 hypothetical protein [Neisseria sp.]